MTVVLTPEIIERFTKPGPRYTSYPTAPEWGKFTNSDYAVTLQQFGTTDQTLSLYIHIPFCVSMCSYCGCNVVIRKQNQRVGDEYLDYLAKELSLVITTMGRRPVLKQFHIGGGTPNYLAADQLHRLVGLVNQGFDWDVDAEKAIEIDPRVVTDAHLDALVDLGFNRISMGIQDFDPKVQVAVNRVQPYELVEGVMTRLRDRGFHSINFDLIYGLPHQKIDSFSHTLDQVIALSPDRIALYSFAHIPWLKSHQNLIDPGTLPGTEEKLGIFVMARDKLMANGYDAIAMDHFAKASDDMAVAFREGRLYRNFMGYTLKPADEYLGIGVTSIGFLAHTYAQNIKDLKAYFAALDRGELPVERGLRLSPDDQRRQWVITQLMCHFGVDKSQFETRFGEDFDTYFAEEAPHLAQCVTEGLITLSGEKIALTELGTLFVRNVAMGFDWYLRQPKGHKRFSSTV